MAEIKRGTAMLLTSGDATIADALADGILTARALKSVKPETKEQAIIRRRVSETLRRIDMKRKSNDDEGDIETRILKAQATYGTVEHRPSVLRTILGKMLGLYGLAVLKVTDYFDFNDRRWRG